MDDEESVNSLKEDEQMFDQEGEIEKPVEHDSSDDDLPIVEAKQEDLQVDAIIVQEGEA